MATKTADVGSEAFAQAVDTFDAALKNGAKVQQEVINWWSELAGQSNANDFRDRVQHLAAEAMPLAQKSLEEQFKLFDESYKSCLDLLKQGFEATQAESVSDLQAKTLALWETSLKTLRNNTEALVQANRKAMSSFADLAARKNAGKKAAAG